MKTVAVIGGGAAGMMAAVTAARNGAHAVLFEKNDRTGKKILATGNGRCNFTNTLQEPDCYRSDNPSFPWHIIEKFDHMKTISFFLELGIYSRNRNGYLYPNSDQASAVAEALRMEADRLGVEIRTETACKAVIPGKKRFRIQTEKGTFSADRVILCMGSKASPSTGSDGDGYTLAKELGHSLIPVLPALVQLRCREKFFKSVAGVRVTGKVSLWSEGECLAEDTGEIQLADYGISGIPVFQVSRYASRALYKKREVTAELDLMPDFSDGDFQSFLDARIRMRPEKRFGEFFVGLFHKKLADLWIRLSKIPSEKPVGRLTEEEKERLVRLIKHLRVFVEGTNSFTQAQVCCGGVDTKEVDPDTLESLYIPGLYFAGEILDVDGICGGYNLQWAWSSGYTAGKEAANA